MQKKNYNDWFDDECRKTTKEKNEARLKAIQRDTRGNWEKSRES